jgi:hypothetical protein
MRSAVVFPAANFGKFGLARACNLPAQQNQSAMTCCGSMALPQPPFAAAVFQAVRLPPMETNAIKHGSEPGLRQGWRVPIKSYCLVLHVFSWP